MYLRQLGARGADYATTLEVSHKACTQFRGRPRGTPTAGQRSKYKSSITLSFAVVERHIIDNRSYICGTSMYCCRTAVAHVDNAESFLNSRRIW